jgi:predicted short-subunit dehydrogenase-like oxidoreductase (DUF2520 family)
MKTLTLKRQVLLAAAACFLGTRSLMAISAPTVGTLNVTVLDETGAMVTNAPVYIFGESKTKFIGGKDIPGTATLDMPAGTYRISSALMRKTGEYYDRFASREAHIHIVPGDNTVVTLHLKALEDVEAEQTQADARIITGSDQIARNF